MTGDRAASASTSPEVSVVIPAFEPGEVLRDALDSVEGQTFQDFDLIVVHDGGSPEDLSWVAAEFPRATVVQQAHAGASVARNRGVLMTSGSLIAFMDQDDVWVPEKLEHQVAALAAHATAGACFSDVQVFDSGQGVPAGSAATGPVDAEVVLQANGSKDPAAALAASLEHFSSSFVVPSSLLIRRECLAATGLLDPWYPFTGDFDVLIRLGAVYDVVRCPSVDVFYRKHAGNFSNRYDVGRRELREMRRRFVQIGREWQSPELKAAARQQLRRPRRLYAHQAFDCARQALRDGDRRTAAYHLYRSARFDPTVLGRAIWKRR